LVIVAAPADDASGAARSATTRVVVLENMAIRFLIINAPQDLSLRFDHF